MKTLKTIRLNRIQNGAALLPLIIALFFMASCAKEDSIKPSANQASIAHSDMREVNLDADALTSDNHNPLDITYTIAKIEHRGGRSLLPTYDVTIQSDGLIIYEGKHNVYKAEKIGWRITSTELANIKFQFYAAHFNQIRDTLVANYSDIPQNFTTYKENIEAVGNTLIDQNDGYPQMLIQVRQKVEKILKISRLVDAPAEVADVSYWSSKKVD